MIHKQNLVYFLNEKNKIQINHNSVNNYQMTNRAIEHGLKCFRQNSFYPVAIFVFKILKFWWVFCLSKNFMTRCYQKWSSKKAIISFRLPDFIIDNSVNLHLDDTSTLKTSEFNFLWRFMSLMIESNQKYHWKRQTLVQKYLSFDE